MPGIHAIPNWPTDSRNIRRQGERPNQMLLEKTYKSSRRSKHTNREESHQEKPPSEAKRKHGFPWDLHRNEGPKAKEQNKPHDANNNGENQTEAVIVRNRTRRIRSHCALLSATLLCPNDSCKSTLHSKLEEIIIVLL